MAVHIPNETTEEVYSGVFNYEMRVFDESIRYDYFFKYLLELCKNKTVILEIDSELIEIIKGRLEELDNLENNGAAEELGELADIFVFDHHGND